MYVALLDAKSAFDVVTHESLLRKLYLAGIEGSVWKLLHSLHINSTSVVKSNGLISDPFPINQGVKQGGILSADLYKLYINDLLKNTEKSGLGAKIGTIHCAAPTCADDVALVSDNPHELQVLINMAFHYSCKERYKLQPLKSVILPIYPNKRKISEITHTWSLGTSVMPIVDKATHMGLLRTSTLYHSDSIYENTKKLDGLCTV